MNLPARMKNLFKDIPAYEKWIKRISSLSDSDAPDRVGGKKLSARARKEKENLKKIEVNQDYFGPFADTPVALELMKRDRFNRAEFERYPGTLAEVLEYMKKDTKWDAMPRIYLAQHPIDELPKQLQDDLPPPEIIKNFGKGDIYGSSLWMGKAPTHTPLHRDPNPNLFVQLSGKKTFRLMRPDVGRKLYEDVRSKLYNKAGDGATMRGEEMMQGEEFDKLKQAVWQDKLATNNTRLGYEVKLKPGCGLYIPLGWWHAVQAEGVGPNVSVNWWFR
ncbi:cupin-like domain-containing protein [Ampelomyces quisqualis]|uniref:Cupin-like domain-containing protein n=1 Tax=Ampelomyces quisqualis TaxID=50730 RepID=A0A6A5QIJ3_AMPQU|nr:cupin-like domain-containing protein [Ampelomyces quisqualis]